MYFAFLIGHGLHWITLEKHTIEKIFFTGTQNFVLSVVSLDQCQRVACRLDDVHLLELG